MCNSREVHALRTPGDMGGEKIDWVSGDPHRRLKVKYNFI